MQCGLEEGALTSAVLSVQHLQPDMERHWFLSLFFITRTSTGQSTGMYGSVLPWLPGPQLCVMCHIMAFPGDGQKRGILERGEKCVQKGLCDKIKQ